MRVSLIIAIALAWGGTLLWIDVRRNASADRDPASAAASPSGDQSPTPALVAAGTIQGQTEPVHLSPQISGRIVDVLVEPGQWVQADQVLIRLSDDRQRAQWRLATAQRDAAAANLQRARRGPRPAEIDAARHSVAAAIADLRAARLHRDRTASLVRLDAASQSQRDNADGRHDALAAQAKLAQSKLDLLQQGTRDEDIAVAEARLRSAEARCQLAAVDVADCQLRAPHAGRILSVDARIGETVRIDSPTPLVRLVDTRSAKVLAQVDEFDVTRIRVGMACKVYSDADDEPIADGRVDSIEPRMHPKNIFAESTGERVDTHVQPVWIELSDAPELPIGLSVDVHVFD